MSKFQLLSCNVALAGDILNVVARHRFNPVTYPELLTLRFIHGDTSVDEVFLCGYVERDDEMERNRLVSIYGKETVNARMFPGAGTRLPLGDERYRTRLAGTRINPGVVPVPDLPPHAYGEEGTFIPLDEHDIGDEMGLEPAGAENNPLAGLLAPLAPAKGKR